MFKRILGVIIIIVMITGSVIGVLHYYDYAQMLRAKRIIAAASAISLPADSRLISFEQRYRMSRDVQAFAARIKLSENGLKSIEDQISAEGGWTYFENTDAINQFDLFDFHEWPEGLSGCYIDNREAEYADAAAEGGDLSRVIDEEITVLMLNAADSMLYLAQYKE